MNNPSLSTVLSIGMFTFGVIFSASAQAEYRPADSRCGPLVACYAACVHGKTNGFADERVRSPNRAEYKHAAKKANQICSAQCSMEPSGRTVAVRKACAEDSYGALLRGDITIVE